MKITAPGVPDFYQGSETLDFSLTDPDNRRPVDFEKRANLLDETLDIAADDRGTFFNEIVENWKDSRVKLFLTTISSAISAWSRRDCLLREATSR